MTNDVIPNSTEECNPIMIRSARSPSAVSRIHSLTDRGFRAAAMCDMVNKRSLAENTVA